MTYELRLRSQFNILSPPSVFSGTENHKFLGPKIWTLLPNEIKESQSLGKLKK